MPSSPTIRATVTFLRKEDGRRKHALVLSERYRPHLVVGPITQRKAIVGEDGVVSEHHMGVQFPSPERRIVSNEPFEVDLTLVYHPEVDYTTLVPGATFTIREGGAIVGFGVVDKGATEEGDELPHENCAFDFGVSPEVFPGRLRPVDLAMIADMLTGLEETYRERMHAVKLVGSRARGTARPTSDFDFLVFLDTCDYTIEVPKLADLAQRLEKVHRLGPVSISPMTSEQFLGLDAKFEGITDNFRRDALRLWPEGRGR